MSQEWKDQRECLRYGGLWRDGRCIKQDARGQRQTTVQELIDVAADRSREAWLLTGRRAAYVLAEARPTADGVGRMRFDGLLLIDRANKAREMAAAEAWKAAERRANA